MKIFSVFITISVLSMGFDWCKDADLHKEEAKTELSKENQNGQGPQTGCSPFCHCVRCSFSLLPESSGILGLQMPFGIRFFSFPDNAPAGIHRAVWQPPKTA